MTSEDFDGCNERHCNAAYNWAPRCERLLTSLQLSQRESRKQVVVATAMAQNRSWARRVGAVAILAMATLEEMTLQIADSSLEYLWSLKYQNGCGHTSSRRWLQQELFSIPGAGAAEGIWLHPSLSTGHLLLLFAAQLTAMLSEEYLSFIDDY